jgi:hypothetical protein
MAENGSSTTFKTCIFSNVRCAIIPHPPQFPTPFVGDLSLQKLQSLAELQCGYFFIKIYIEIKIYLIIIKLQA